ncbi:DUF3885 domain-containing protein [Sporosarcina sp. ANT_H38]|uniref:DUF3885 domain-containing protein n=1 Tax=Sporosarcina sp. ANT_H38 TaxID=2597358 RepID=UPI0011F3B298|nr:DUF3885 domain-containing protein [Sporosarcina sp. ANT_H38]KAA0955444.1 DUF3885 domain-containing protein [Sporosarcina sp. ANT_H38]
MNIMEYLNEKFPTVELVPTVYYQWDIGIHFSLGKGIYQLRENGELNLERFRIGYKQTLTIFKELFDQNDDLFLVTNIYRQKTQQPTKKMKVYQPNLRDKNKLKQLQVKTYPYPFEENEREEYEMQQFSLHCKVNDIRVNGLLKAAINEDFPLKPRFGGDSVHYPDVFFVNITKDIIFFVYDDRGCEVISRTADRLRPLYEKYYDWIEGVDRERIQKGLRM